MASLGATLKALSGLLKRFANEMLFVDSPVCPVCKRVIFFDTGIACKTCMDKLSFVESNKCSVCKKEINDENVICAECMKKYYMSAGQSVFIYDAVSSEIIKSFKYNTDRHAALVCGEILACKLKKTSWIKEIDIITCVPGTNEKLEQRGYNQAVLIAEAISETLDIPFNNNLLHKCLETKDQIGLSYEQRFENVKGAFGVTDAGFVTGKRILIADDVFTSGATINECSRVLLEAGAVEVFFATVALALE